MASPLINDAFLTDHLNETQIAQLKKLLTVFLEENSKINLSALRDDERCWIGNILDSLGFLTLPEEMRTGATRLDIGTGGGFPLLPLAIVEPESTWHGLDAIGKKIAAIGRIAEELTLSNVELTSERTEIAAKHRSMRDSFPIVTARAVASLPVLIEWAAPFVEKDGYLVLWKSMQLEEEWEQSKEVMQTLHCTHIGNYLYELPGDFGTRQLIVLQKTQLTPTEFPRAIGEAKKKPLGS